MNTTCKEMLLNTIKNKSLFMLMRDDNSFLSMTYNVNSEYPYHISFSSDKTEWEHNRVFNS